jgi:hypothetical protein
VNLERRWMIGDGGEEGGDDVTIATDGGHA